MDLKTALRAYLSAQESPEDLDVRECLWAMKYLNERALRTNHEHMLCIVRAGNGIDMIHEVEGTEDAVWRFCDVQSGHYEGYKGSIHTHLEGLDGVNDFGLSFGDFYGSSMEGDHIALVVSGPKIYGLYRIGETRPFERISKREWVRHRRDFREMPQKGAPSRILLSQRKFTCKMCSRLGYVFYEGSIETGLLKKVWVP